MTEVEKNSQTDLFILDIDRGMAHYKTLFFHFLWDGAIFKISIGIRVDKRLHVLT